jgi:4-coumarate--CoA ligase
MSSGHCFVPAVFLGIIASGGVVSSASHSFTAQELARQIKQGQSNLIVCSEDLKNVTVEAAKIAGLPQTHVLVMGSEPPWSLQSVDGGVQVMTEQRQPFPRVTDREELKKSLVVLLWSSGTTGVPKGVMLSHLNLVSLPYQPFYSPSPLKPSNRRLERTLRLRGSKLNGCARLYSTSMLTLVSQTIGR